MKVDEQRIMTAQKCEVWRSFCKTPTHDSRQQLIDKYTPFARNVAAKLFKTNFFPSMEFEDYIQYAMVGLIESIERYAPERGVDFQGFAYSRIRGAVQDGVNEFTESANQMASKRKLQKDRLRLLQKQKTKGVKDYDLNDIIELTLELGLGILLEGNVGDETLLEIEDSDSDPYKAQESYSLKRRLQNLLSTLPRKQSQVLDYHYLNQIPFSQIAEMLKISAARTAQLHRKGLQTLYHALSIDSYLLES